MPTDQQYKISASSLNLRSEPIVAPRTLVATLPHGHPVTKLDEANDANWWRISTALQGASVEGFVNRNYLTLASDFTEPPSQRGIRDVHLQTNDRILRSQTGGRAFPLNEDGRPRRDGTTAADRAGQLGDIINWLRVDQSRRYLPVGGTTFCNIYAYDYCYLAGVYLPRVWWTRNAIATLASGGQVSPQYGTTVTELNANSIYNWFEEFGANFGWLRTFDLTVLQDAANAGKVCIINGQRTDLNRPGHICPVVPEVQSHAAVRRGGAVTTPLQSQAGASNFRYGGRVWWTGAQFRRFAFWVHG